MPISEKAAPANYVMTRFNSKGRQKISHCGTRSPKYLRLCHFTLLFCRGRATTKKYTNIQNTRVESVWSLNLLFCRRRLVSKISDENSGPSFCYGVGLILVLGYPSKRVITAVPHFFFFTWRCLQVRLTLALACLVPSRLD